MKKYCAIWLISCSVLGFYSVSSSAKTTIKTDSNYRYIISDGIPNHQTGKFPGRGNPNAILAQNHQFRVALNPQKNAQPTAIGMNNFGVAINGIPFDPATAEFWQSRSSGWNEEGIVDGHKKLGIDVSNAHVQPTGAYHYHGVPLGIVNSSNAPELIGYAADGFPIYVSGGKLKSSYHLKNGNRPSNSPAGKYDGTYSADYEFVAGAGDLDVCNGHDGKTPEYPNGIYHYVITEEFPFIPRCWVGNADDSFKKKRGGSGRNRSESSSNLSGERKPPQEALQSCASKSSGQDCFFTGIGGENISGTCRNIQDILACVPTNHRHRN
ncbi:MAG: hypothetical protein ACJAW3_000609 [Lentimonas sp.]|jgi:hypothetical protein